MIRRELVVANVSEDTDVYESDGGDGLQATEVRLHTGQVVFEDNDLDAWIFHDFVDYHPVRYGARTEADRYADSDALERPEQASFLADLGDENSGGSSSTTTGSPPARPPSIATRSRGT